MDALKSKKWQSMVMAICAMFFEHGQGAPWYVVVSAAAVACAYLISQGMVDAEKAKHPTITPPAVPAPTNANI